jgi:hypothetical protein
MNEELREKNKRELSNYMAEFVAMYVEQLLSSFKQARISQRKRVPRGWVALKRRSGPQTEVGPAKQSQ